MDRERVLDDDPPAPVRGGYATREREGELVTVLARRNLGGRHAGLQLDVQVLDGALPRATSSRPVKWTSTPEMGVFVRLSSTTRASSSLPGVRVGGSR